MHEGVRILTLLVVTYDATPKIHGFTGLSQLWELHSMVPDMVPSAMVTLAGAVLSRLCAFYDNDDI